MLELARSQQRGAVRPGDLDPSLLGTRPMAGAAPRRWHDAGLGCPGGSDRGVLALHRAYLAGGLSPVDVLAELLSRLERGDLGASVHSPFACLDPEVAMEGAMASQRRFGEGHPLGVLDGVPVPVKDDQLVKGLPAGAGTVYRTWKEESDSVVVERLRRRGALVYGKTRCTEWGMDPAGRSPHFPMPRNPYDGNRCAGGSSTGSAVAVSLGLAPLAVGSDGGGSLRVPAALCGTMALKPSFGLIDRGGNLFGSGSLTCVGAMAMGASDLAVFLAAVAGPQETGDPIHRPPGPAPPGSPAGEWLRAPGRGVRGCRVGILERAWAEAEPGEAMLANEAIRELERDGASIVSVEISLARHAQAAGVLTMGLETLAGLGPDLETWGSSMGRDLLLLLAQFSTVAPRDHSAVRAVAWALKAEVASVFSGLDVLLLPASGSPSPPFVSRCSSRYRSHHQGPPVLDHREAGALCRHSFLASLLGLPAGSVPVGMAGGMPVGIQVVGDAWDEASVLAVMGQLERAGLSDIPAPAGRRCTWEN